MFISTETCALHTGPHHHHHHQAFHSSVAARACCLVVQTIVRNMSDVARTGAAVRRRERRPRSWLRHEPVTVAPELSATLHHIRDGVREKHVGLRAKKTDSSGGMRPTPLCEVAGPQDTAATVGHVAAGAPLLVVLSTRRACRLSTAG